MSHKSAGGNNKSPVGTPSRRYTSSMASESPSLHDRAMHASNHDDDDQEESIATRIHKLEALLDADACAASSQADDTSLSAHLVSRQGLIDTLLLLYEECNNTCWTSSNPYIAAFIDKYSTAVTELRKLRISSADFDIIKTIGRGHFGEVKVVKEKTTHNVYAMKVLKKSDTLARQNVAFFEEERDIMASSSSEWITQLQYAFHDAHNLYLVMEYHAGGDLLSLLTRYDDQFEEPMVQFYIAEMVVAINDLHNMGYVHRDIKPENVLISHTGHIRLADFGSACKLHHPTVSKSPLGNMPVGTPDYICPELLEQINASATPTRSTNRAAGGGRTNYDDDQGATVQQVGVGCDWWAVGVCAYEMLFAKTPFSDEGSSKAEIYANIINHKHSLVIPKNQPGTLSVSTAGRSFISGLLTDAKHRMQYQDIVKHDFLSAVDIPNIGTATPPYTPHLSGADDTVYFDEFSRIPSQPLLADDHMNKTHFSGKDLPFIGFTYIKPPVAAAGETFATAAEESTKHHKSAMAASKERSGSTKRVSFSEEVHSTSMRKSQSELDAALRDEDSLHQSECGVLRTQRDDYKRRADRLETERDQLERDRATHVAQIQSLKRDLALLQREHESEVEEFKASWDQIMRQNKAKIEQKYSNEQMALCDLLGNEEEKVRKLEQKMRTAKHKYQAVKDTVAEQQRKIHQLEKGLKESQSSAEKSYQKLRDEMKSADKKRSQRIQELTHKKLMLEDQVAQLQADNNTLAADVTDKSDRLCEAAAANKQIAVYKEKCLQYEKREKELKQQLNDKRAACTEQTNCVQELKEELDSRGFELDKQKRLHKMKETQYQAQIQELEEAVSKLREEYSQCEDTLMKTEQEAEQKQCVIDAKHAKIVTLEGEVVSLNSEISGLRNSLHQHQLHVCTPHDTELRRQKYRHSTPECGSNKSHTETFQQSPITINVHHCNNSKHKSAKRSHSTCGKDCTTTVTCKKTGNRVSVNMRNEEDYAATSSDTTSTSETTASGEDNVASSDTTSTDTTVDEVGAAERNVTLASNETFTDESSTSDDSYLATPKQALRYLTATNTAHNSMLDNTDYLVGLNIDHQPSPRRVPDDDFTDEEEDCQEEGEDESRTVKRNSSFGSRCEASFTTTCGTLVKTRRQQLIAEARQSMARPAASSMCHGRDDDDDDDDDGMIAHDDVDMNVSVASAAMQTSLLLPNQRTITELEAECKRLQSVMKELQSEVSHYKESAETQRIRALDAKYDLREKVESYESQLSTLRTALNQAEICVSELETSNKSLQQKYDTANSKLQTANGKCDEMIVQHRAKLTTLQEERDAIKMQLDSQRAQLNRLESVEKELATTKTKLHDLQPKYNEASDRLKLTLSEKNTYKSQYERALEDERVHTDEIRALEKSVAQLKAVCTELDEQLQEYEAVRQDLEQQKQQWKDDNNNLETRLSEREKELINIRQELTKDKLARQRAEGEITNLRANMEGTRAAMSKDLATLRDQLKQERLHVKDLGKQLNTRDKQYSTLDYDHKALNKQLQMSVDECFKLKEESTALRTQISELRHDNESLYDKLEQALYLSQQIHLEKDELADRMDSMQTYHSENRYMMESTIGQHAKLIDYLKAQVENPNKKKKGLFGNKKVDASVAQGARIRAVQHELDQERERNSHLRCQITNLKDQIHRYKLDVNRLQHSLDQQLDAASHSTPVYKHAGDAASSVASSSATPLSSRQYDAASSASLPQRHKNRVSNNKLHTLTVSPAYQTASAATAGSSTKSSHSPAPEASTERIHHNIPHRFLTGLNSKPTTCALCLGPVPFVKQAAKCTECSIVCHPKCAPSLPATCGLPTEYATHYLSMVSQAKAHSTSKLQHCVADLNMEMKGWMKIPRKNKDIWERRWVELKNNTISVYESDDPQTHDSPIDSMVLLPERHGSSSQGGTVTLYSGVTAAELTNTASSDLPYVLMLEYMPDNSCWPGRSIYLMALTFSAKQKWVATLSAILNESKHEVKAKLSSNKLVDASGDNKLDVNSMLPLSEQLSLVGTEDGLYAMTLKAHVRSRPLHRVSGVDSVHLISQIASLHLILMVTGKERRLQSCSKAAILGYTRGSGGLQEMRVDLQEVLHDYKTTTCSTFTTGTNRDGIYLALALTEKIVIAIYSYDSASFVVQKEILTSQPCSCLLFNKTQILVGSDKFYCINTTSLKLSDFLDSHDPSLTFAAFGAAKFDSFPISVHKISPHDEPDEFLLCFNEFGVCVDGYGRRSRQKDIKWAGLPLYFAYDSPYLYVISVNKLQVMLLDTAKDNIIVDCTTLTIPGVRYIGPALTPGAIYVATVTSERTQIICFKGNMTPDSDVVSTASSSSTGSSSSVSTITPLTASQSSTTDKENTLTAPKQPSDKTSDECSLENYDSSPRGRQHDCSRTRNNSADPKRDQPRATSAHDRHTSASSSTTTKRTHHQRHASRSATNNASEDSSETEVKKTYKSSTRTVLRSVNK